MSYFSISDDSGNAKSYFLDSYEINKKEDSVYVLGIFHELEQYRNKL